MVLMRRFASPPSRRRTDRDEGAVAVMVAIVLVGVIFPLMAIVVDVGLARMLSQQSRAAADAGALAAAGLRPLDISDAQTPGKAVDQIKALVAANTPTPEGGWVAAWSSCVDPNPLPVSAIPGSCISFDFMKKQVRVSVPNRPVPTVFSGLLGANSLVAGATSTGTWGTDPPPTCGLCVLGDYVSSTATVAVSGDGVAVGALLDVPGGTLTVTPPTPGSVTYAKTPPGQITGIIPTPVQALAPEDPFAAGLPALRTVSVNGPSVYGQPSQPPGSGFCRRGIYQDISACTAFEPNGTYFVTGVPGTTTQVSLKASGLNQMLLFFTCSAPGGPTGVEAHDCATGSQPRFTGTATGKVFTLTAPANGPGLALVFDNGMNGTGGIVGGGTLIITGDVYGRDVVLGNVGTNTMTVKGHVVVGSVNYTTAKPTLTVVAPPPVPKPVPDGPVRLVRTS